MNTVPEAIELTGEQQRLLVRIAEQTGKPWPQVLEEALSSLHVPLASGNHIETVADRMRRFDLLGSITDGPEDLSTNPKYMEGFGEGGK